MVFGNQRMRFRVWRFRLLSGGTQITPQLPTGIVDEDRYSHLHLVRVVACEGRDYVEVVVVVAGDGADGEVPHPACAVGGHHPADDGGSGAVRGLEALTIR
jgi:hypothetical protein